MLYIGNALVSVEIDKNVQKLNYNYINHKIGDNFEGINLYAHKCVINVQKNVSLNFFLKITYVEKKMPGQ